jgi:hypothetical protein
VRGVQEMLFSLHCLVCRLMMWNMSSFHIAEVKRAIKIFLTYFELFDKAMRIDHSNPTWISSYNFVCSLNLPNTLADFGPICNYWEGGGMGEKMANQSS